MRVGVSRKYHFTLVGLAKKKKNNNTHCWAGCWKKITPELLMETRIVNSLASKQSGNIYDIQKHRARPPSCFTSGILSQK